MSPDAHYALNYNIPLLIFEDIFHWRLSPCEPFVKFDSVSVFYPKLKQGSKLGVLGSHQIGSNPCMSRSESAIIKKNPIKLLPTTMLHVNKMITVSTHLLVPVYGVCCPSPECPNNEVILSAKLNTIWLPHYVRNVLGH
jgi:hypothetical protein